jgi:tRNA A37 N6-isopentenylltransferase MiaA
MEGGVLRKEDEEKYRKMFPQLSDTPELAKAKLQQVDKMLRQKLQKDVAALKSSGYDVGGLEKTNQGLLQGQQQPQKQAAYAPGEIVFVDGKKYKVGADGDSLDEIK